MSNLFRNKNPSAPFDKVKIMLPHLARLLMHHDSQVVTDAAWAISYVTDDDNNKIQAVIDHNCVHPLVKLLERDDASIIVPSLRSIGNIVTGNDQQVRNISFFFWIVRNWFSIFTIVKRFLFFWLLFWTGCGWEYLY